VLPARIAAALAAPFDQWSIDWFADAQAIKVSDRALALATHGEGQLSLDAGSVQFRLSATRYTVQDGDTIEGIALRLWGDASYWYLIAEANGLTGAETLAAGRTLTIPNKIHNAHNNSDVYRVYDPNEIIGSTSPNAPKAPKKNKCGTFGAIMMVAIAVAVTVVTSGAAVAAATSTSLLGAGGGIATVMSGGMIGAVGLGGAIGIGAGAAALGSIASQGFGVATGIQSKFNWAGVALSALAGGVSAGLGTSFGKDWAAAGARGALSNVITQGIGITSGLQSNFNWAGVATAGIGAGVSNALGWQGTWGRAGSGIAAGLAAAAGESLITGNSFGDTLISSLPSIIGNTIGNLVAGEIVEREALAGVRQLEGADGLSRSELRRTLALTQELDATSSALGVEGGTALERAQADPTFRAALLTAGQSQSGGVTLEQAKAASLIIAGSYGGDSVRQTTSNALSKLVELPDDIHVVASGQGNIFDYAGYAVDALAGVGRGGQYISDRIDANPLLHYSLIALDIASGPIAFAARTVIMHSPVGEVIEGKVGEASDWISGQMRGAGIDPERAFYATSGAVLLGGLALGATRGLNLFRASQHHLGGPLNLASPARTGHILFGDATGGGHKFGISRLFNGKTKFPATWSSEKIMTAVSDIASDPNLHWKQQTGISGSLFTKSGKPARFVVEGVRSGTNIKVVIEPAGQGIITAHPLK
jgi:hypothetical protein